MASVSSAHLVLFIAAVLVAAVLAGTATQSATNIGNAIEEDTQAQADQTDTEIRVVSDPESPNAVYNHTTGTLTLLVKNTGGSTIPSQPSSVTVLVNGSYQNDTTTTVLGETEWRPGALLRVEVTVSLQPDSQTRVVVTPSGARDVFIFTTP